MQVFCVMARLSRPNCQCPTRMQMPSSMMMPPSTSRAIFLTAAGSFSALRRFAQFLEAFLFRLQRGGKGTQRAQGAAAVVEGLAAGAVAAALFLAQLFQAGAQHVGLLLGLLHGTCGFTGAVDAGLYFAGQFQRFLPLVQQGHPARRARVVGFQFEPFLARVQRLCRACWTARSRAGQALAALPPAGRASAAGRSRVGLAQGGPPGRAEDPAPRWRRRCRAGRAPRRG